MTAPFDYRALTAGADPARIVFTGLGATLAKLEFASPIISRLRPLASNLDVVIEPGRCLVADAGALVLTAEYVKEVDGRRVIVADAGMNALLRPALYDAYHRVLPILQYPISDFQPRTSN